MANKEFETGAVRSKDADNERWDLISPIGLRRIAETCHEGAVKYGDLNWEQGMPISDLLNHAIRHIYIWLAGNRDEDHLAHAAWGLLAAMHSEESWPHLNQNLRSEMPTEEPVRTLQIEPFDRTGGKSIAECMAETLGTKVERHED